MSTTINQNQTIRDIEICFELEAALQARAKDIEKILEKDPYHQNLERELNRLHALGW